MATTLKAVIAFPAAVLAFAALASCGGDRGANAGSDAKDGSGANAVQAAQADLAAASRLFPDNFKGVCSGASVSAATAYDPRATAHKALYFATYRDDFMDKSSSLPRDWTVTFSAESDALRAIDLVVCARRAAAREVKVCDGYQNNGRPTQNRVRWHVATYELSVREARTGRQLAQTTVEATSSDCPMFMSFQSDSETVDGYASLSDSAVADFLRPHITR
ncbi:MAG TPA: hypothetical protein VGO55_01655 [Allosphingosinicella sp.]|nr:hypothetical protein [Allosphingosinicella sp.]